MNPATLYAMGVKRNLHNYYANWLPDTEVRLGDVGILRDRLFFERITTLKELGIPFKVRKDAEPTPLELVSDGGVSVHFKAAGETDDFFPHVPAAEAAIGVEFNREGAFVFRANECYEPSIESLVDVQDQVVDLMKDGRWDKSWVIVVKTVTTPLARLLVSEDRASQMVLTTKSKVDFRDLSLGNARVEFDVKRHHGRLYSQLGAREMTPFFQVARLKSRLFAEPRLRATVRSARPTDPMEYLTPEALRNKPQLARELYLDVVKDAEEMPYLMESLSLAGIPHEWAVPERPLSRVVPFEPSRVETPARERMAVPAVF